MRRRTLLGTAAGLGIGYLAGSLGLLRRSRPDVEFEVVEPTLDVDEPPDAELDDRTVTARGTVLHGSSACGTVDLAHARYEPSQDRLDLLVVAADDTGLRRACTDDLVEVGYRLEATVDGRLRRAAVTEHHVFGETHSTTVAADE